MTTYLAQNQFISNPSVICPRTERSAVASKPPPVAGATAAPIAACSSRISELGAGLSGAPVQESPLINHEPSMTMEVPSEASAPAPTKNPDADALDCVHEIFFYARKLSAEARTFVPDYEGIWDAMHDSNAPRVRLDIAGDPVWADELPLFIREDGYLKRQA